jgi:hypothetical protein
MPNYEFYKAVEDLGIPILNEKKVINEMLDPRGLGLFDMTYLVDRTKVKIYQDE